MRIGTSALISMMIAGPIDRLTNSSTTPSNHDGDDGEYEVLEVRCL